jgi:hypothetical protein
MFENIMIGILLSFLGIIILVLIIAFIDFVIIPRKIYLRKKGVIVGVNGIKDNDTGLFANGSTNLTTFIFGDGEVINVNEMISGIFLNRECKLYFNKTRMLEEVEFERIEYIK